MSTILGPNGKPIQTPARGARVVPIRARYDAAETTAENSAHWANADGRSAKAANSHDVRKKLRERARYENGSNSYCAGIVSTLANNLIGTGPRLQLTGPDLNLNRRIADDFEAWTAATGLAEKLRTMRQARAVDGESFAIMTTNPRLGHPVQLDLKLIEAEQVTSPYLATPDPLEIDGIRFDEAANPVEYTILAEHPGSSLFFGPQEYTTLPAELVLHWFRADRPGQVRGIPDITPALPLFAQLRRYTLAVIAAAETAADFAAVLYSEMPADGESMEGEPFETLQIERRMMTTLPAGWQMSQFKAEQPTTTYAQFKAEILKEIARCLNMPFNVAAGDSSGYNYSSGRLDHQTYYKSISVDQYHLETAILDRIFAAWMREYALISGSRPPRTAPLHAWFWDGFEHVDPLKEASAQEIRLRNNTTTLADEWGRRGFDWRQKAMQRAEEVAFMTEIGLPPVVSAPNPAQNPAFQPDFADYGDPNNADRQLD